MSHARILPLLLAPLLVAPGAGCARAQAGEDPLANCHHILVSSAEETGDQPALQFSATRTVDLTFSVGFRKGFTGSHVLELRVYTPDGHLYRKLVTPITADQGRAPRLVPLPGHRRPVLEQQLRDRHRARTGLAGVDVAFPVAGTDIISAGLYGAWRVEARLDGGRTPCHTSTTFTLTE